MTPPSPPGRSTPRCSCSHSPMLSHQEHHLCQRPLDLICPTCWTPLSWTYSMIMKSMMISQATWRPFVVGLLCSLFSLLSKVNSTPKAFIFSDIISVTTFAPSASSLVSLASSLACHVAAAIISIASYWQWDFLLLIYF